MVLKILTKFMASDPNKTKMQFFLLKHEQDTEGQPIGYLSMPNEDADALLQYGWLFNTGQAAELGAATHHDQSGNTFILEETRGRRTKGGAR